MSAVQDVLALNAWLASLRAEIPLMKEHVKKAIEAAKHAGVHGSGGAPSPNGGNQGDLPQWTGPMPPWALSGGNAANNPFLTNGFAPPTKPEGGG